VIQTCALGLEFHPLSIQLYQTLADLYLEKGASQQAIDLPQAAKAHPCPGFSASKILIRVYENLGRDEEATSEAIGLTVTHPDRWDTYSELWGTLTSTSGDNKTTNILLKLTTRQYPRWEPFVYLAHAFLEKAMYQEAIDSCVASIEIKKHPSAAWTLSRAYEESGRLNEAFDTLCQGIEVDDIQQSNFLRRIAFLCRKLKRWKLFHSALIHLKEIANGNPDKWDAEGDECLA
jgi:tetratricopeptide (TPR) repeat protein